MILKKGSKKHPKNWYQFLENLKSRKFHFLRFLHFCTFSHFVKNTHFEGFRVFSISIETWIYFYSCYTLKYMIFTLFRNVGSQKWPSKKHKNPLFSKNLIFSFFEKREKTRFCVKKTSFLRQKHPKTTHFYPFFQCTKSLPLLMGALNFY